MDVLGYVGLGFSVALEPLNLLFCFVGVLIGTLVGVLPGLGPVAAVAFLLSVTFKMAPATGIIMLAGIYYGAMYGGSTTSILVNIPGETASVVTCLDGYQMARQGRAGPALGISAFGSFIAGTLGVVGLMFLAPLLGQAALKFGPPEFFALTFTGLTLVSYLSQAPLTKSLIMAVLGLSVGSVGMDPVSGEERFTQGLLTLRDGFGLVPVAMGMFGIAEVLENLGETARRNVYETAIKGLLPNLRDWKDSFWPIVRGSVMGFFLGILPGPGPVIASFASYATEKRLSRHPEKFGTGAIEGVAGPESANNSATAGSFIPLLSLGIPTSGIMALFMGALMIHGIQPGPLFIRNYPELFWGVVASMYVGNAMLLILNLPLIGLWVRVLKIPYAILFPLIFLFCLIGVYSLNGNVAEIFIMVGFGIAGFLLRKAGFEGAPFLLAMVLGPIMESSLRQSLIISHGSFSIFFTRPISGALILLSCASLITPLILPRKNGNKD
ncbi:MAG: transporter [Deltaproteobacteria bacterium RIFCSPLOWO2_02_FULL_57_26]|nr:MAG: transporter [Deltaproteobacteria bacterium RIFCSPLOWO2_02_FULL_57_26]OGQ79885.1 MAG: transporter [Deltaproteobacteria bacterium RIFCSPLOWO2_12_FULL_57_22]